MDSLDTRRFVRSFRNCRVLIAGDVMLDRYLWGTVTRLSPEAPIPIVTKQRVTSLPGGAANVAANIAALGGEPVLFSVTGNGHEARELQDALQQNGVRPDHVISSPVRKTTVKTRIIAHGQQVVRIDEEQTEPIDTGIVEQLYASIDAALPAVSAVVLSDYAKGVLTPALLSRVIARSRDLGIPVLVDPKGSDYARYHGASLLTPNRSEAFLAATLPSDRRIAEAGSRLMDALAIDALLITEGESGMTLFERDNLPVHLSAAARAVFDVTGAGDAVVATIGLALASGASLRQATYLGNVAGGLAVEQVGTTTVKAAALEELLEQVRTGFESLPL
jgi:rfaE bifunctional protein kinase chain/domain